MTLIQYKNGQLIYNVQLMFRFEKDNELFKFTDEEPYGKNTSSYHEGACNIILENI